MKCIINPQISLCPHNKLNAVKQQMILSSSSLQALAWKLKNSAMP